MSRGGLLGAFLFTFFLAVATFPLVFLFFAADPPVGILRSVLPPLRRIPTVLFRVPIPAFFRPRSTASPGLLLPAMISATAPGAAFNDSIRNRFATVLGSAATHVPNAQWGNPV